MPHPSDGVLRRMLDEPAGVATADRDHVARCETCRRGVAAMQEDADFVHAALSTEADGDVALAWQRLSTAASSGRLAVSAAPRRTSRLRGLLRQPAVAGALVAVVLAGAGAAAANGWLEIFRTERIVPVSLHTTDLNALPDLHAYGEVVVTGEPGLHLVADAEAAAAATGLDVPEASALPRGVVGAPTYQVGRQVTLTFTFSAERAARAAAGRPLPTPPPGVDGSRVRLVAGPGVAVVWSSVSDGRPDLVVGRAAAPRAFSDSGVPFEVLRDYLLSLPGLPESAAATLRTFNAGASTLPLPVPADQVATSETRIDGAPATVLSTRDRSMAAVTWVTDGVVTAVAGPLDTDEVVAVARGLR